MVSYGKEINNSQLQVNSVNPKSKHMNTHLWIYEDPNRAHGFNWTFIQSWELEGKKFKGKHRKCTMVDQIHHHSHHHSWSIIFISIYDRPCELYLIFHSVLLKAIVPPNFPQNVPIKQSWRWLRVKNFGAVCCFGALCCFGSNHNCKWDFLLFLKSAYISWYLVIWARLDVYILHKTIYRVFF